MSRRHLRRRLGLSLVGALAISACGASESTDGDRDRNVQAEPTEVVFAKALDGVARNKVGDVKMAMPISSTARQQKDGSTLVAVTSVAVDKNGARSEIAVSRIDALGLIDDTFGNNGVRDIVISRPLAFAAFLSDDGHMILPAVPIDSSTSGFPILGATRFDLTTGDRDVNFGEDGFIQISSTYFDDVKGMVDGGDGVFVLGTSSEISTDGRYLSRWTKDGRDNTFGGSGLVAIPNPDYPLAQDEELSCDAPSLWPDGDTTILVTFGCVVKKFAEVEGYRNVIDFRRFIATRRFSVAGIKLDQTDAIAFLDNIDELFRTEQTPSVLDVVHGFGDDSSSRYFSIDTYPGSRVIKLVDGYTRIVDAGLPQNGFLPSIALGSTNANTSYLGYPRFIPAPTPLVAGVTLNTLAPSLDLNVGKFTESNFLQVDYARRLGDFPLVTHGFETLRYVGDEVFMNLVAETGGEFSFFSNFGQLSGDSGYMKIARDGSTLAPYGSADGMALSPLNKGFPVQRNVLTQPGLFAAIDGSMLSLAAEMTAPGPGGPLAPTVFHVQRYDASGKETGSPSTISVDEFSPMFDPRHVTAGYDGANHFYVIGSHAGNLAVAKLSISDGTVDATFGTDGFANLPTNTDGWVDPWWYRARVQVNANGSIDLVASEWSPDFDSNGNLPLQIATIRFTSLGALDSATPPLVVTLSDVVRCLCIFDPWYESISQSTTVDSAGRILIAYPRFRFEGGDLNPGEFAPTALRTPPEDEQSVRFLGGGEVQRFLRSGELDPSFGTQGIGGVDLYQLGIPFLLSSPRIAVDARDNIYMSVTSLELRVGKHAKTGDFDLFLDGEYSYALMLDSSGNPLNFTPREAPQLPAPVVEVIRESRAETGLGEPVSAPVPATEDSVSGGPVAAVAAAPGASADSVIPADIVEITQDDVPVITVTGTPADRTIDVRWSIPASLANVNATYTVTATPGGQKCTTATNSCVFKKLEPWTNYSFAIKTVRASSSVIADSAPSIPVKPVRIVKRKSRTAATKLVTPASKGRATWKVTGGCGVTKDGKTFTATKDAGVCTLSVTTAKSGKTPKTTRVITVVVRAVAK
ncbi:MAG: hypothetical protein RIQ64_170 [Actinomycetota bacterium]